VPGVAKGLGNPPEILGDLQPPQSQLIESEDAMDKDDRRLQWIIIHNFFFRRDGPGAGGFGREI